VNISPRSKRPHGPTRSRAPLLGEVVLVDLLKLIDRAAAHADVVPNHEPREFRAVDQHDALADALDIVARALAEGGGSEKDAFGRAHAVKAAREALHL
jgi:hypothetical protein